MTLACKRGVDGDKIGGPEAQSPEPGGVEASRLSIGEKEAYDRLGSRQC